MRRCLKAKCSHTSYHLSSSLTSKFKGDRQSKVDNDVSGGDGGGGSADESHFGLLLKAELDAK